MGRTVAKSGKRVVPVAKTKPEREYISQTVCKSLASRAGVPHTAGPVKRVLGFVLFSTGRRLVQLASDLALLGRRKRVSADDMQHAIHRALGFQIMAGDFNSLRRKRRVAKRHGQSDEAATDDQQQQQQQQQPSSASSSSSSS